MSERVSSELVGHLVEYGGVEMTPETWELIARDLLDARRERDEKGAQIVRLEAEITATKPNGIHFLTSEEVSYALVRARREVLRIECQLAAANKALRIYGRHLSNCKSLTPYLQRYTSTENYECDCGLRVARAAEGGEK